jgi:hypothetical protein
VVYNPHHAHADFLLDPAWQDVLLGAVEGLLAQGEEAGASRERERGDCRRAAASAGTGGEPGAAADAGVEGLMREGVCGVERWRRLLEAAALAAGQRGSSCGRGAGACVGR